MSEQLGGEDVQGPPTQASLPQEVKVEALEPSAPKPVNSPTVEAVEVAAPNSDAVEAAAPTDVVGDTVATHAEGHPPGPVDDDRDFRGTKPEEDVKTSSAEKQSDVEIEGENSEKSKVAETSATATPTLSTTATQETSESRGKVTVASAALPPEAGSSSTVPPTIEQPVEAEAKAQVEEEELVNDKAQQQPSQQGEVEAQTPEAIADEDNEDADESMSEAEAQAETGAVEEDEKNTDLAKPPSQNPEKKKTKKEKTSKESKSKKKDKKDKKEKEQDKEDKKSKSTKRKDESQPDAAPKRRGARANAKDDERTQLAKSAVGTRRVPLFCFGIRFSRCRVPTHCQCHLNKLSILKFEVKQSNCFIVFFQSLSTCLVVQLHSTLQE